MAPLEPIHWQTITPQMRQMMDLVGQSSFVQRFYLAGGTALALRVGHRRSVDLDFFSETDELTRSSRQEIIQTFLPFKAEVLEDVDGNLLMRVANLRIGFFGYGYKLVDSFDTVSGVNLASLADIGLMKLDALGSRGSRKDFYDTYVIAQHLPLLQLLAHGRTKYPYSRNFELIVMESMILFDNADGDIQPELFIDLQWDLVKQFFLDEARKLGTAWFDEA